MAAWQMEKLFASPLSASKTWSSCTWNGGGLVYIMNPTSENTNLSAVNLGILASLGSRRYDEPDLASVLDRTIVRTHALLRRVGLGQEITTVEDEVRPLVGAPSRVGLIM